MIRVWGRRNSVNVQKVLWTLGELELPFTRESVGGSYGGNREADFLQMNPLGLVPVVRDGDVTMFESNAIVRYLCARYGQGSLRPADFHALATAEQWMEFQQQSFGTAVSVIFFNTVRLPPAQRNVQAVAEAEKKAMEALHIADAHLARSTWFAGANFTMADIVMGAFMWRYMGLSCAKPEIPHALEWFEAIKRRPAFKDWVGSVAVARDPDEWLRIERDVG